MPPGDPGAVKVVLPSPSTCSGAVEARLAKLITTGGCLKFSRLVLSVSALSLIAEARRSRIRAATSAVKRPAWSRLAKEARASAATTAMMAQTIKSSSREKPGAAERALIDLSERVVDRFMMETPLLFVAEQDAIT